VIPLSEKVRRTEFQVSDKNGDYLRAFQSGGTATLEYDSGSFHIQDSNGDVVAQFKNNGPMIAGLGLVTNELGLQNGRLKNVPRTGSSTDPRADTTADDWMEVDINGTTHYVPLYT